MKKRLFPSLIGVLTATSLLIPCARAGDGALFDGGSQSDGTIVAAAKAKKYSPVAAPASKPIDSDWVEDVGQAPGGDPGSADQDRFRENFQNRTLENICRLVRITGQLRYKPLSFIGIQIGARRSLRRYPDGSLALVDEQPVRFAVDYNQELVKLSDKLTVGMFFGGHFDGQSTVVLPLKNPSCSSLKVLLNPTKMNSIIPLTGFKDIVTRSKFKDRMAKRIATMEVGEVWKMPIKPAVGWGPNVTVPIGEASFNVHWQWWKASGESISLKKLSADQVRFRFRLDRSKSTEKGASVQGSVTADDMGIGGRFAYKELMSLFNQYFRANISGGLSTSEGREAILEYVLNPNVPEQMEALVKVAAGDISALDSIKKMLKHTDKLLSSDANTREGLERMKEEHDEKLGSEATFAGADVYKRDGAHVNGHFPFLFRYDWSQSEGSKERMVLIDEKGGEIKLYPASEHSARGIAEVPILGDLDRFEKSSGVQVYTYKDKTGVHETANAVYIQQRAFTREGQWAPNGMLSQINDVMRYVGVRGKGTDPRKEVPLPAFRATVTPAVAKSLSPKSITPGATPLLYAKGMSAFTLIFSRKAIQDIINTPPTEVVAAYHNALGEAEKAVFGQ
ncbi:MAG: hypothetical protein HYZ74_07090, partial [Elusimicrobia bacterium]|nr:hypothetical protein [Elusimicrobiota bacterium]